MFADGSASNVRSNPPLCASALCTGERWRWTARNPSSPGLRLRR